MNTDTPTIKKGDALSEKREQREIQLQAARVSAQRKLSGQTPSRLRKRHIKPMQGGD